MGQFQDLKAQAAIIRDEQNSYQNTSLRVGRMFIDILEQLEKVLPDENVKPETLTVEATETSYKLKFSTLTSDGSVKSRELDLPIATDTKAGVMSPALMKGIKDLISQLSLKVDSNKTDSDNKISELASDTNTKVFTTNDNANKVIRKLFIDTSGITSGISTDGLYIDIIAKNVDSLWGILIKNSNGENVFTTWLKSQLSIQSVHTSNGLYLYAEYNWDNMEDGQLPGSPFTLTNEVFHTANDPRSSVTSEKIADNSVTSEKIVDNSVEEKKLSDEVRKKLNTKIDDNSIDLYKIKLTPNLLNFNVSNIFNVLDYEGFNSNPSVWASNDGGKTSPIITIEEQSNILGLKYARCFSIKDVLYNDSYYSDPYFTLKLNSLKNIKTKSFCFYVNISNLYGSSRRLFSGWDGSTDLVEVSINWGTDTYKENSKVISGGVTSSLSVNIAYIDYNNEKWAFVRGKFSVDDISLVNDRIPSFLMGFVGGQEHIGEKTITCGWTFVAGDVELLPFIYYPYNKNFFELFTDANIKDGSISTDKIAEKAITQNKIDDNVNLSTTTLTNGLYGQVGDSISEGVGLQDLLPESDIFNPISGKKKATYGYYIAKLNRMRWANYGISGSTLGFVVNGGQDHNGFSKENGRYTQMDDNLTHLSIFFGWNDAYYGPIMKREEWLQSSYDQKIYYPSSADLIGTNAEDGTPYATQEQYEAVNSVTGQVDGVNYDNNSEYFKAMYVGTENDSTNKTFWGAWNIVLPYLINKYPFAKILLIVPFGCYTLLRQCVRDAAKKYGLATYDFSDINNQLFRQWEDNSAKGMIDGKSISQFRIDTLTYDGLHPNKEGYEYMYPSINIKLMSL